MGHETAVHAMKSDDADEGAAGVGDRLMICIFAFISSDEVVLDSPVGKATGPAIGCMRAWTFSTFGTETVRGDGATAIVPKA